MWQSHIQLCMYIIAYSTLESDQNLARGVALI